MSRIGENPIHIPDGVKVEIKGNSSFSDSQLRALMKTRFGRFFNKDTLANDLEKITHYYQNYGYYFACVKSSHFEFSEEEGVKWITIFLEIVETASKSPGEAAGKPASITSTPIFDS